MESYIYKEIGNRIRIARNQKGWTQQELSEKVGLTRTSITNIELGRQKIQIHILYKFADALGSSVKDLLPETDELLINFDIPEKAKNMEDQEGKEFLKKIFLKSMKGEEEK